MMMPVKMEKKIVLSHASGGFTILELVMAMLVTSIFSLAMVFTYSFNQKASDTIRQVSQMQQQLRGSMYIMEQDIRIAGFDPMEAGIFGVTNVQRWTITNATTVASASDTGSPSLTLAYDWNPANPATNRNGLADETIAYRLFDEDNDGIFQLARDDGTLNPRPLLAEGIEAIGFAYAYDFDDNGKGDGELDRNGANIIWAVDSDNDNLLDTNLDADGNGVIDLDDDTNGDFRIDDEDGAAKLITPVPVQNIRMVRIWMLARARSASRDFNNNGQQFLVGDQVVPADDNGFSDNIRRLLLIRTVECRNAGL